MNPRNAKQGSLSCTQKHKVPVRSMLHDIDQSGTIYLLLHILL